MTPNSSGEAAELYRARRVLAFEAAIDSVVQWRQVSDAYGHNVEVLIAALTI